MVVGRLRAHTDNCPDCKWGMCETATDIAATCVDEMGVIDGSAPTDLYPSFGDGGWYDD